MSKAPIPWDEQFPIYPSEDFDMCFPGMMFPIGVKSTTPVELIRRIVAAVTSYQLRNESIDYTYKRYLNGRSYATNDGTRLDIRISNEVNTSCELISAIIYNVTSIGDKRIGNIICEWTFMRVPHSIMQMMSLAQRGNLYECCAIGRVVLEQIAWAVAIDNLDDDNDVRVTKAEACITSLKRIVRYSGSLYGWLSIHAHWRYDGHIKSMDFGKEGMAITLQSSRFKAISLTAVLLLTATAILAFKSIRDTELSSLLKSDMKERLDSRKSGGEIRHLFGARLGPSIAEVEALLNFSMLLVLVEEIRCASGGDADVERLFNMASELFSGS
jgi:hypothetical protein